MGVLRVLVNGVWVDIGGASDEVVVGPDDPILLTPTAELWYDTDATSVASAPLYSGRNLVDNGQMAVRQRLATSVAMGAATVLADRWYVMNNGLGASTLTHGTLAGFGQFPPAGRPRPGNMQYIQMTTAEAAGALAAGDQLLFQHAIEGLYLQHLNWGTADAKPLTISFDIYSSIATTYAVELIRTEPAARSNCRLLPVPAGFSTQTFTISGDAAGTAVTNDNAARLYFIVWIGAGSTATSGVMQSGWAPAVSANRAVGISNAFAATVGNVVGITNVQIEAGSQATPYEVRGYDQELMKCMRYFRQTERSSNLHGEGGWYGYSPSAMTFMHNIPFPVPMRTTPSRTFRGTFANNGQVASHDVLVNSTSYTISIATVAAAGNWAIYSNNNGYLEFSAEI